MVFGSISHSNCVLVSRCAHRSMFSFTEADGRDAESGEAIQSVDQVCPDWAAGATGDEEVSGESVAMRSKRA